MDEKKMIVLHLYGSGATIRGIAKTLGISKSTIHRWIQEILAKPKTREKKREEILKDEIWDRIINTLMLTVKEKGRTRALSIARVFELFKNELKAKGIDKERTFRRYLERVIKERFGSWEAFELKRRDKSEFAEFRRPKGKQRREPAEWEIDATAYTFRGELYFFLCVRERWSGMFLKCLVLKAREDTKTLYYNRAFNAQEVAKFLMKLFQKYGLPYKVITDNDQILTSKLIERGLKTLNIQITRTKPYSPSSKIIERAFRDIKDNLRYYVNIYEDFERALEAALEEYNKSEHRFEHFSKPVIPEVLHSQVEYRRVGEEEIRRAFMERFERAVRNNSIRIDNLIYEFIYTRRVRNSEKLEIP